MLGHSNYTDKSKKKKKKGMKSSRFSFSKRSLSVLKLLPFVRFFHLLLLCVTQNVSLSVSLRRPPEKEVDLSQTRIDIFCCLLPHHYPYNAHTKIQPLPQLTSANNHNLHERGKESSFVLRFCMIVHPPLSSTRPETNKKEIKIIFVFSFFSFFVFFSF